MKRVLAAALVVLALIMGCAGGQTYEVQPGDSLAKIALEHGVTQTELIRANQDRYPKLAADGNALTPGMELVIPQADGMGFEVWFDRLSQAASPPVTPAPNVPAAPNDKINAVVQLIGRGINRERVLHNLNPLVFDARLAQLAQARSNDMIKRQYFSHNDPETGDVAFQELIIKSRYQYTFAGENIAEIKNQGTIVPTALTIYARYGADELAEQFVTGWINSPEHRENIYNPNYARTGIALGVSVDGTRIVATQIFSD